MSDSPGARTRTFSWSDPLPTARAAPSMSGLEFLQAIGRGELPPPPIMALMNLEAVSAEHGRVVFAVEPAEYHYNPIGVVHGGLTTTILDTAMSCAVHSTLPAGVGYTTLELKTNFVRPLTAQVGRVTCVGTVVHVGTTIATAEGRVVGADGTLYAHGVTTCLIMRPPQRG